MKFLSFLFYCTGFIILSVGSSCTSDQLVIEEPMVVDDRFQKILFLGHIYEKENTIDPRIEFVDRSAYQHIWLGGDICSETTKEESTLDYLDDLFDLDSPYTHWTLGNHDTRNGNLAWITNRTQRKTFYTAHFNGITMLVLNSILRSPDDCDLMEEQLELIKLVCDTMEASTHLVVMTHHVMWQGVDAAIMPESFANVNGSWIPVTCQSAPNPRFEGVIFPELVKVKERGISVICLAGDLGQEKSNYEFTNEDGILFLGSGITSEIPWNEQFSTFGQRDTVLRFLHDVEMGSLSWEFVDIEEI